MQMMTETRERRARVLDRVRAKASATLAARGTGSPRTMRRRVGVRARATRERDARTVKLLGTTLFAVVALAGPASADVPFTVGSGESADVAVGEDGTIYVAWDDGASKMTYCRIPPGATTCATTREFLNPGDDTFADHPQVLVRESGAVTVLEGWGNFGVAPNRRTYTYNSSNGVDFAAGQYVGVELPANAVYTGGNSALIASEATDPRIGAQRVSLFAGPNLTRAGLLPGAGNGSFDDPDLGLAPKAVVAYSGSGAAGSGVFFNRYLPAAPGAESLTSSWSAPSALDPQGSHSRVGAGSTTTWLMYKKFDQNNAYVLRQWNGTSFGQPIQVGDNNTGDYNDVAVSPNDEVYAVWNRSDQLRWFGPGFINGGTSATGQAIYNPRVDANTNGLAVAAWQSNINGGPIKVSRLGLLPGTGGPAGNQPPKPIGAGAPPLGPIVSGPVSFSRQTSSIGGIPVLLSLAVPRSCVPSGSRFRATLRARQITRLTRSLRRKLGIRRLGKGGFKVTRVDFSLDGRVVRRDRRRPFEAVVGTLGLARGKHTVRATVRIKRKFVRTVSGRRRAVLGKRTYKRTLKKSISICL